MKINCMFWLTLWTILKIKSTDTFKLATSVCLAKHNQISLYIDFKPNCEKEKPFENDFDDIDSENHACFMMRWHCSKICTNDGICSVAYLFTLNRKVDQITGMPKTLDCICGYDKCQKGCSRPIYVTEWKNVDEKFKAECSASCTQNLTIDGAKIVYDSEGVLPVPLGKSVTIKCIEISSTLMGPPVLTCMSDEKWDTNPPYCQPGCPTLSFAASIFNVVYTQKFGNKVGYLGTAKVACVEPSSTLIGAPLLTCGKNEQFDQKFPICKPGCSKLTVKPNIKVSYTQDFLTKIKYKGTARFQCIILSSTLMGQALLTCQGNEIWDKKQPSCLSGCSIFAANSAITVSYLPIFNSKVKYQGTASFGCPDPASTLIGESLLTCNGNEKWDKNKPHCKTGQCSWAHGTITGCATFALPSDVQVKYSLGAGNKVKAGGTATFSCSIASSVLIGDVLLTCKGNGIWDRSQPSCKTGCATFTVPSGTVVKYTLGSGNMVKFGGTASFSCSVALSTLIGDAYLTCKGDNIWNSNQPSCKTGCATFTVPSGTVVKYTLGSGNMVKFGGTASFSCSVASSTLIGDAYLTCKGDNIWDSNQPSCKTGCAAFTVPSGTVVKYTLGSGNKVKFGGTASFSCSVASTTLIGDAYLTCKGDNIWDSNQPSCKTGCAAFTVPSGTVVKYTLGSGNMVKFRGTASFSCSVASSTLVGDAFLTCNGNGIWDSNQPSCKTGCEKVVLDSMLSVTYALEFAAKVKSGGTASFTCKDSSYTLTGATLLTCSINGQWNNNVPSCKPTVPKDTKSKCLALANSFYLNKKCFAREKLCDMSKNENQCTQLTHGQLMTKKTQAELIQIVDAIKIVKLHDTTRGTPETADDGTNKVVGIVNDNLKPGQVIRLQGHITHIETMEASNKDHIMTLLNLGGITNEEVVQHLAFAMKVMHNTNIAAFLRYPQTASGTYDNPEQLNYFYSIPAGLRDNEDFDMTITYRTDSQLEVKLGTFSQLLPYAENEYYLNYAKFTFRGEVNSLTIAGKELKTANDKDNFYSDCMIVGLRDTNRVMPGMTAYEGWVWENGDVADPATTLWDTAVGEPNNKYGNEHYACVNVFTYKLRDFPDYLKKFAICEYDLAD